MGNARVLLQKVSNVYRNQSLLFEFDKKEYRHKPIFSVLSRVFAFKRAFFTTYIYIFILYIYIYA